MASSDYPEFGPSLLVIAWDRIQTPLVLTALIGLGVTYLVGLSIYSLYWNPLSNYPGPKLCALSRLPWVCFEVNGGMAKWIQTLHRIYGDVVRVAPDELSFSNGLAWNDIYGSPTKHESAMEKSQRTYVTPGGGSNRSIVGVSNEEHPRLRRALLHPFSERSLKEIEPLIRRHLETLVSILDAGEPTEEFDLVLMYNHAAFDIMSDYAFGEPLNMQTSPKYRSWVDTTFGALWEVSLLRSAFYYPWTSIFLPFLVPKSLKSSFQRNYEHCVEMVNDRLALGTSPTDLLGQIMSLKEEFRLTPSELHVNLQTLMVAGTETSAALLSSVTYYLLRNPRALEKLTKEIRSIFETASDINQTTLKQMPYVQACIEEALRLLPPVPVGAPRIVPSSGRIICDKYVPGNTIVNVSPIAIGRNPQRFKDAQSFIPERWLGGSKFTEDDRSALQPFSFGPRNCLGKSFAYHKARMTLAMVFWHFDISLCKESAQWVESLRVWSVWERRPLMVTVKRRTK